MRKKMDLNSPILKKVMGIGAVIFAGIVAVSDALDKQMRDQEFEDLKKSVSELQNKNEEES